MISLLPLLGLVLTILILILFKRNRQIVLLTILNFISFYIGILIYYNKYEDSYNNFALGKPIEPMLSYLTQSVFFFSCSSIFSAIIIYLIIKQNLFSSK
jgi:hypothetical protein